MVGARRDGAAAGHLARFRGLVAKGILVGVVLGVGTAVVLTGAVGGFWAWLVALVVGAILGALFALVNILLLARMRALQGKEPIHRSRSV